MRGCSGDRPVPLLPIRRASSCLALLIGIRTEPTRREGPDRDERRGRILDVFDRGVRRRARTAAASATGEFQSVVLVLLANLVLAGACHTPLSARKDAGPTGDAGSEDAAGDLPSSGHTSPDAATDALVSPDLVPVDVAIREVQVPDLPTSVPKAFRFVNHTDRTAYVRVDGSIGCRRQGASGFQFCSFFELGCMPSCDRVPANGGCCFQCEQPLPSLYAIAPAASRVVPWDGVIHAKDTGACSQCECETAAPAQSGAFEASARVYADYQCSSMPSLPCQSTAEGIIEMADPRGNYLALTVPFSLPYSGDEIVLDIDSLPATDAGVAMDLGRATASEAGGAAEVADASSSQESGACQPLAYSHLGPATGATSYCPVDPKLPECASADVGALVYRDEVCGLATLAAHPQCSPWSREVHSEYVFLSDPFGGCGWPITVNSVLDCGDHVEIDYAVTMPCNTCDGVVPSTVMLIIRNDPKPVLATAKLVPEKC
jgi:hypothetical protein